MYSQVVPLAAARSVHTLRAVFGETYPDPVRVVSVGAPVESLLADPENPAWMGVSVELCGGTHVKNTSAAGRFAVLEEGSIAKGVRRMIAVTRDAAIAAHERATELEAEFAAARALSGAALDARCGALKAALEAGDLPAARKALMREALGELNKRVLAEAKAAAKKVEEAGKAAAVAAVAAAGAAGAPKAVVAVLPIDGAGEHQKAVLKAVGDADAAAAFLAVSTNGSDKLLVFAACPPAAVAAGLKASEWVAAALAPAGGRSGGKDDQAQGTSKEVATVDAVVAAAKAHAAGRY